MQVVEVAKGPNQQAPTTLVYLVDNKTNVIALHCRMSMLNSITSKTNFVKSPTPIAIPTYSSKENGWFFHMQAVPCPILTVLC